LRREIRRRGACRQSPHGARSTGIKVALIEPGPIASRFLEHALEAYRRNIDLEASPHSEIYRSRIARLEEGGSQTFKLGPEAVALKARPRARKPQPQAPLLRYHPDLCRGIAAPVPANERPRRCRRAQLECRRVRTMRRRTIMEFLSKYAIPVALAAVAVVLLAGLWNMMRGGSPNTSQLLMRWRVILQFIALCLVMLAIYLAGK
jgi:hypothetical protein